MLTVLFVLSLFLFFWFTRGFLLFVMDCLSHSAGNNLRYVNFICFCCYIKKMASINRAEAQCQQKQLFSVRVAVCSDFSVAVLKSSRSRMLHGQHCSPEGPRGILRRSIYCCGVVSRDMIESVLVVWLVSRSRIDVRVNVSAL